MSEAAKNDGGGMSACQHGGTLCSLATMAFHCPPKPPHVRSGQSGRHWHQPTCPFKQLLCRRISGLSTAPSSFLGTAARDLQCSLVRTQNQLVQARGGTGAWAKGNRTCTRQGRAHEGDSDEEEEEGVNSVTAKLSR